MPGFLSTIISSAVDSRLGRSFGFLSLAQAVTALTNFGIITLFTQRLHPEEFGKISISWLFVVVMSTLIDCRLNTAFSVKYYKSDDRERSAGVYSILLFNLLLWGVVSSLIIGLPHLVPALLKFQVSGTDLQIICLLIMFMVIGNFYSSYLIVSRQSCRYFLVMVLFNGLLVFGSLLFLLGADHGYRAYLEAYLAAYVVISCIGLLYLVRVYPPRSGQWFSRGFLLELLKISAPLIPDGLTLMLLTWTGRYVLNLSDGLTAVGIYSVAFSFSNIFNNFIVTPFGQAIFPVAAERFVRSRDEYVRLMQQIFKYYWVVILGVILIYSVVLQDVYRIFIGKKYFESYPVVFLLLTGTMFWGAASLLSVTVIMKEKTGQLFKISVISAAVNVTLCLLLVPYLGMYGAAIAIVVGYAFQFLAILAFTQRLVRVVYDYAFVARSVFQTTLFIGCILWISLSNVPYLLGTGLKLLVSVGYALFAYRTYNLRDNLLVLAGDIGKRPAGNQADSGDEP